MEQLLDWVKSGLLFGVFSSVILLLVPNRAYQKHVGLVVGLLFLLVMLHPLMTLLQVDGTTYLSYLRNYFSLEQGEVSGDTDRSLYEEAVSLELSANLQAAGYAIDHVSAKADETGEIQKITLYVDGEITGLEPLELYLKQVFGKEIQIRYEAASAAAFP